MKLLLTTSPADDDKHGVRSLPPLNLAYLGAGLKGVEGLDVEVFDPYGEDLTSPDAAARVLALAPDIIGISATDHDFEAGVRMLKAVKAGRPEMTAIMGGYHPTRFDELMLRELPELDMVLRGEADSSLPELCRRLLAGRSLEGVPGLSYRLNGDVVRGEPQQVEDLDALPFPDRSLLTYGGYYYQFAEFVFPKLPRIATVVSSRGCPHHCVFCPKLYNGWGYRGRSAENIFEELLKLYDDGTRIVFFSDENFSYDLARLEKLCRMILDHKLKMRFIFQGTLHHLTDSICQLMHKAGFDAVFVGVESGSDDQLRRYRKPTTRKTIAEGIRKAKRAHMLVIGFFICGAPEETDRDCQDTYSFVQNVRPHVSGLTALTVHPNCDLWPRLIGQEPRTLAESGPRRIYEVPGQIERPAVSVIRKEFQKAFAKSWFHPARIRDVLDLALFNGMIRPLVMRPWRNWEAAHQLFRGGPKKPRAPKPG